jgi:hypothetical protein
MVSDSKSSSSAYKSGNPHSADTVVSFLKKTANVETRSKLIAELRSLDQKRLEILDQLDGLAKPT